MNGKGSKSRVSNFSQFSARYDEIDWGHDKLAEYREQSNSLFESEYLAKEGEITDGFGNSWSIICAECGQKTMEVVRPGKIQCQICG